MEWPLWSPETKTLVVFDASNEKIDNTTEEGDSDLIIDLSNFSSPRVLFDQDSFPFNLDHVHAILFSPSSNNTDNTTGMLSLSLSFG